MANPFNNIVNTALKYKYTQAIEALIAGLQVNCRITYPITKFTTCATCTDTLSGGPPNPFLGGQLGKFTAASNCPECGGSKKRPVITTEIISLCVIWEPKKWVNVGGNIVFAPAGSAQTICGIGLMPKIKGCNYIELDINKEAFNKQIYRRVGEPILAGLENNFLLQMWEISG